MSLSLPMTGSAKYHAFVAFDFESCLDDVVFFTYGTEQCVYARRDSPVGSTGAKSDVYECVVDWLAGCGHLF